ncbi:MAG: glycine cleavage system protein H [Candidatus Marinimicrobia bacterium]|nr:glycine cleavage system protein H [Candidatus Neomarinimicrobiota bacterium]
MNIPNNLKYTKEHEWVKIDGDTLIVGITDYAQSELGDIIFVELPFQEDKFDESASFGTVEAVKTVSDLYMPITGTILEVNKILEDKPELINAEPYNEGWIIKIKADNINDVESLLDSMQYKEVIS